MKFSKFELFITKYLTNSISAGELDQLAPWLEKNGNDEALKSYIHINYAISYAMAQYDADQAKKNLLKKIRKDKRTYKKLKISRFLRYAAVAVIFLSIGFLYREIAAPDEEKGAAKVGLEKGVSLKLADGSIKALTGEGTISILDNKGYRIGLQNGNQLIYHRSSNAKKLEYNTLKVPYGKRFAVLLSDGTKVNLNAGSTIRYPVAFVKGKMRKVFLDGEAYFEVTRNKEQPFVVSTGAMDVRVLGTQFNLSAYSTDVDMRTVLVEGAVGLFEKDRDFKAGADKILEPGDMATWVKAAKSIQITKVDTDLYTGWMDGKIVFDHMPFREILKKLERTYGVNIVNKDSALNRVRFTANFDTETIGQVLESFNKSYPITYKVMDQENIVIEQP